jgi:hypothetical protein
MWQAHHSYANSGATTTMSIKINIETLGRVDSVTKQGSFSQLLFVTKRIIVKGHIFTDLI